MHLVFAEDAADFYRKSAVRIAEVIRKKPSAKIGLSTGRTTKGVHAALAEEWKRDPFDCSRVKVFGIDEITNMSRECPASCYYILLHEVIEPLGIAMEHFIMPDPGAGNLKEECRRFEAEVMSDGGPDFIFLGLGENGHLGFNQPGTPFGQTAWISWMDDSLNERLRREYKIPAQVVMGGLTLGVKNLMQCPGLVMAANGKNKKAVAEQMVTGPVTEALPASVLQLHPACELILDPEAAGTLPERMNGRQGQQFMGV